MRKSQQHPSDSRKQQGAKEPPSGGTQQGQGNPDHSRQPDLANVHGEGNYAASRQYNDATRAYAKSGKVDAAARAAAPSSDADALQMAAAEAEGKRHSKGEDPALSRKSSVRPPEVSRTPKPGQEE